MRYEMWENKPRDRMVNLTSHIAHPTSKVEYFFVLRIANWELRILGLLEGLRQQNFFYTFVIKPVKFLIAEVSPVPLSLAVGNDPESRQSSLLGPIFGASEKTATNTLPAERRMHQELSAAGEVL